MLKVHPSKGLRHACRVNKKMLGIALGLLASRFYGLSVGQAAVANPLSQQEQDAALAEHNEWRETVGVAPLTWSNQMANLA